MNAYIRPQAGDIVLVCGTGIKSALVRFGQRVLRGETAYSHCAMNLIGDVWCEAMPEPAGVRLVSTKDLFQSPKHYKDNWRVIRLLPTMSVSEMSTREYLAEAQAWIDAVGYFHGQPYNKLILFRKGEGKDTSSFCSELIAKVFFRKTKQHIFSRSPQSTLPVDFEFATGQDITDGYHQYLRENDSHTRQDTAEMYKRVLQLKFQDPSEHALFLVESYFQQLEMQRALYQRPPNLNTDELEVIKNKLIASKDTHWRNHPKIDNALRKIEAHEQATAKVNT